MTADMNREDFIAAEQADEANHVEMLISMY